MPRRHESEFWPVFWAWSVPGALLLSFVVQVADYGVRVRLGTTTAGKVWTEQEAQDRFLLKSMDEIRAELGPASFTSTDSAGNIACLRYYRVPVAPDGRKRDMYFFARGNRCNQCGFDGPP